jgi:hypothetical protein
MLVTGNDFLSPILNLGWLALAFVAAWCIGLRVGRPGMSVLAVSVLMSLPIMPYSQGGSADVDLPGVAILLATIALVVHSDKERDGARLLLLAAAGAGLLLGIKLIYLPIVLALVVGVVVTSPKVRNRRHIGLGIVVLFATGAYWYVRNLVRTGSPLPSAPLRVAGVGFARIPDATLDCGSRSVASYVTHPAIWRSEFAPMLRYWFGPLWWLVLLGTVFAIAAAIICRNEAMSRPIGMTGLVAMIGYVVTPATAGGTGGIPSCFGFGTRLLFPTLALGAIAVVLVARRATARRAITAVLAASLAMTWWSSVRLNTQFTGRDYALSALLLGVGGLVFLVVRTWEPKRSVAALAAVSLVALAIVGLSWQASTTWRQRRSVGGDLAYLSTLAEWANSSSGMRIAIAGFGEQWPLYGKHLQNVVRPPTVERERGALRAPTDCDSWREALRAGDFDRVVIRGETKTTPLPQRRWIAGDPAATPLEVPGTDASVYVFDSAVPAAPCSES